MYRRHFLHAGLATALSAPAVGLTQGWPAKDITLVVPYGAAGSTDMVARLLASKLAPMLGHPVVVDNRAGGAGNIGAAYVARSPADGYRVLLGTDAILTLNPHLNRNLGYSPAKDLAPVALVSRGVLALAVSAALPVKTLADFVAYVKKHPKEVFYGAPGTGSPQHVVGAMLNQSAGIDMTVVQYKGFTPTVTDLIGGSLHLVISTLASLQPYVESGRVRLIAIAEPKRFESMPELPAVAETYPGFELTAWNALFVPAATPRAVVDRLNRATNAVLAMSDVQAQFKEWGLPLGGGSVQALAAQVAVDYEQRGKIIRQQNIRSDS